MGAQGAQGEVGERGAKVRWLDYIIQIALL